MTAEQFRELVLAHQGAEERSHMGHPDFRVNGRIFATIQADDRTAMVKVAPEEQRALMEAHPGVFRPAAGAWGRQGCTLVDLSAAAPKVIRGPVQLAYEAAVAAVKPRRRRR